MRLFSSLAHYLLTTDQNGIQVHQYAPAEINLAFGTGRQAALSMETRYPWEGAVRLRVLEIDGQPWHLRLRLPGWCPSARLLLNGQEIKDPEVEKGYLVLNQAWQAGDVIQLELSMAPVLVESNPRVDATRDCLAIQRGPLVYCLEATDNPGFNLMDIQLEEKASLEVAWHEDGLPEGMMVVQAKGYAVNREDWQGRLYRPLASTAGLVRTPVNLVAIPYYAWAHRGLDGMRIWIPRARV